MHPIAKWIDDYSRSANTKSLVVGISGGVDSALTSTLTAETGRPSHVVSMPIHSAADQVRLAQAHADWLRSKYANVTFHTIDLTSAFECFRKNLCPQFDSELGMANTRARLRMITLYQIAASESGLVIGTGNRIEDFGIGFFTKYGDGGVDISPIAHLNKSEVRALAAKLGVSAEIIQAAPTDGLWPDGRTDEDQLRATYGELEWAMDFDGDRNDLSDREREVLHIYEELRQKNRHKMNPIPTFKAPSPTE